MRQRNDQVRIEARRLGGCSIAVGSSLLTVCFLELLCQRGGLLLIHAKVDGVEPVDLLLEAQELSVVADISPARRGCRKRTCHVFEQRRRRGFSARVQRAHGTAGDSFHAPTPAGARIIGPPSTSRSRSKFVSLADTAAARRDGNADCMPSAPSTSTAQMASLPRSGRNIDNTLVAEG